MFSFSSLASRLGRALLLELSLISILQPRALLSSHPMTGNFNSCLTSKYWSLNSVPSLFDELLSSIVIFASSGMLTISTPSASVHMGQFRIQVNYLPTVQKKVGSGLTLVALQKILSSCPAFRVALMASSASSSKDIICGAETKTT